MGILSLVILYPAGNLKAIDAYFFGASGSTESGLNTYVHRHDPEDLLAADLSQCRREGTLLVPTAVHILDSHVHEPRFH